MLDILRSLSLISILAVAAYACSDDDPAPGGGQQTTADGGTSSTGTSGSPAGTSGGTSTQGTDAATTTGAGATFIKVDGVVTKGSENWQNPKNTIYEIEVLLGQGVGQLPGDASFRIEIALDNEKAKAGTFGAEAALNIQGMLSVFAPDNNPKKGLYVTRWNPADQKGITFTMSVKDAGTKLTFSWKGSMKENGGDKTVEVDIGATDITLKAQKQTP